MGELERLEQEYALHLYQQQVARMGGSQAVAARAFMQHMQHSQVAFDRSVDMTVQSHEKVNEAIRQCPDLEFLLRKREVRHAMILTQLVENFTLGY